MQTSIALPAALLLGAGLLAGCSSDGSGVGSSLTTSALSNNPAGEVKAAPRVDPACIALTAKIDALRKEGVMERVEKAAEGKSTMVSVKRTSLAKLTELDKANAEFQARCSTISSRSTQALATTPPTTSIGSASPPIVAKPATSTGATVVPPVTAQTPKP